MQCLCVCVSVCLSVCGGMHSQLVSTTTRTPNENTLHQFSLLRLLGGERAMKLQPRFQASSVLLASVFTFQLSVLPMAQVSAGDRPVHSSPLPNHTASLDPIPERVSALVARMSTDELIAQTFLRYPCYNGPCVSQALSGNINTTGVGSISIRCATDRQVTHDVSQWMLGQSFSGSIVLTDARNGTHPDVSCAVPMTRDTVAPTIFTMVVHRSLCLAISKCRAIIYSYQHVQINRTGYAQSSQHNAAVCHKHIASSFASLVRGRRTSFWCLGRHALPRTRWTWCHLGRRTLARNRQGDRSGSSRGWR